MSAIGAELSGKTCVVTGAARSIGLAIAEAYREAGAQVAMIDLNPEVTAQAERLAAGGAPVKGYVLDITDRGAVLDCFARVASELGDPYALVNNAGIVPSCSTASSASTCTAPSTASRACWPACGGGATARSSVSPPSRGRRARP